jgi:hypothetical protein
MKFLYFHLIYCTIIAFLGYHYWSSEQAFKAFEHVDKQLNVDYSIIENSTLKMHREIDRNRDAYVTPYTRRCASAVENNAQCVDSLNEFLALNKLDFIKINGGLDTSKNHYLINANSTKTSKLFFTDTKIEEIKDKLRRLPPILLDSIEDTKEKAELFKLFYLPKLIDDNSFWALLKTLPASGILAELSFVQNQIKMDEMYLLNYYLSKTAICGLRFDAFKTAIAPKKAALIEGEIFEADIYLAAYSSSPNNFIIQINGDSLTVKDGVAHFKGKRETIGTKTIKAQAIVKNPLTGVTKTTEGYFEYQVLPKCSRDCQ